MRPIPRTSSEANGIAVRYVRFVSSFVEPPCGDGKRVWSGRSNVGRDLDCELCGADSGGDGEVADRFKAPFDFFWRCYCEVDAVCGEMVA